MRLNVVPLASALLAASLQFASGTALAGDAAVFDAIGFSDDGRYFGYEEYGIQDGSGFPYDTIYLIDLIEDKWASPPVRVRLDVETAELATARQQAMDMAKSMLAKAPLVTPAEFLLMNANGEAGNDEAESRFSLFGNGLTTLGDPLTLTLSTFPSTTTEPCASYGMDDPVLGFAVTLTDSTGNSAEIYRDASVPASRGCVSDYRLHAVVAPFPSGASASPLVAVISVYSLGFEGPDRRFVTIPIVP